MIKLIKKYRTWVNSDCKLKLRIRRIKKLPTESNSVSKKENKYQ